MDDNDMINLMKQKRAQAHESEGLNQSVPKPRPQRDLEEEQINWKLRSLQVDSEETLANISASVAILSSNVRCCKTSFDDLKSIKLCEMKVPMIHEGKYLVCQSISDPIPVSGSIQIGGEKSVVAGIHCLVKDLNGDVEEVNMYNFLQPFDNFDWISPGTIFIIKEPWLRYGSQGKDPTIQIYSPSDVIFVDASNEELLNKIGAKKWYIEMSKNAEKLRRKGNKCFKQGKFEMALTMYDRGIRCNPELAVLYLDKALICLRTGAYYDGYKAAKVALEKGGDREKTLYRLGQAAYGMREWQKAATHFLDILKDSPQHADASEQLKRANARLAEQKDAKYDFKSMHIEGKKEKPNLDVADYVGPIEIANIPGKARGIIASEDIQEGTLLIVSKAFATGYAQDFPADYFETGTDGEANMLQEIKTMQTLQKNPQCAKEIYDLYAGDDDMPQEEIPEGIIDAERIQKICALNRFGSRDTDDCSLFILPSYLNHACLANAYRNHYGDVMVINAITDIKKGDEITISYVDPFRGYLIRKAMLNARKFTCSCKLCELDAADPYCLKRNQMFKEFEQQKKYYYPQQILENGEALLQKIRETYVDRKELQIVLAQMLRTLSGAYYDVGNIRKLIECLKEIITLMDNPLKRAFGLPSTRFNLAMCSSDKITLNEFKQMVVKAVKESFCVDFEHFQMLFPEFAYAHLRACLPPIFYSLLLKI